MPDIFDLEAGSDRLSAWQSHTLARRRLFPEDHAVIHSSCLLETKVVTESSPSAEGHTRSKSMADSIGSSSHSAVIVPRNSHTSSLCSRRSEDYILISRSLNLRPSSAPDDNLCNESRCMLAERRHALRYVGATFDVAAGLAQEQYTQCVPGQSNTQLSHEPFPIFGDIFETTGEHPRQDSYVSEAARCLFNAAKHDYENHHDTRHTGEELNNSRVGTKKEDGDGSDDDCDDDDADDNDKNDDDEGDMPWAMYWRS